MPLLIAAATGASPLPQAPSCPIFPPTNPWNERVDGLPVAQHSAQIIANIGLLAPVMPDFGAPVVRGHLAIGVPINVVSNHTRWAHVRFRWADQSNRGPYPLPRNVKIQGGVNATGDRHVIVVDRDTCMDYELYAAYPHHGGARWSAGAGAIFNLRTGALRPRGWTSADAAGLPILPGLARYDEVARGQIDHALRFTVPCTARRYVYPARHWSFSCPGRFLPAMGTRVRLKSSVDISHLPYQARVIALALKRYGMIVADDGGPWEISGAPDPRWNNAALLTLELLKGQDFEVVDTSSLPHPR